MLLSECKCKTNYLSSSIASRCKIFSFMAEPNTTNNTRVFNGVREIEIQISLDIWIISNNPIRSLSCYSISTRMLHFWNNRNRIRLVQVNKQKSV